MTAKKYFKIVCKDENGTLASYTDCFVYKPKTWHDKSETSRGTPFFVFTTRQAAEKFEPQVVEHELWECEIDKPFEESVELGHISKFKPNAVFCNKVKLTKCLRPAIGYEELYDGAIFRIKGTKQYLQYNSYDSVLEYLGGKKHGEVFDSCVEDNIKMMEAGRYAKTLIHCPDAKLKVTVEVTTKY